MPNWHFKMGRHKKTSVIKLRKILESHTVLIKKIEDMEKKYGSQFRVVFEALKKLLEPPPEPPRRRIGFHADQ